MEKYVCDICGSSYTDLDEYLACVSSCCKKKKEEAPKAAPAPAVAAAVEEAEEMDDNWGRCDCVHDFGDPDCGPV